MSDAKPIFENVKPFPQEAENPRVVIGSNSLPMDEQAVSDFADMIDAFGTLRSRITELVASAGRATAVDDETAGRCAALVKQMHAAEQAVVSVRNDIKAPYEYAVQRVETAAARLTDTLSREKLRVRDMAEDFVTQKAAEKQATIDRLAIQRKAEIAKATERADKEIEKAATENREADPEIVQKPDIIAARRVRSSKVKIRSDLGATVTSQARKVGEITDWAKAYKAVKTVPGVKAAIQTAIDALVRAGQRDIAGVEIKDAVGIAIR